MQEKAQGRNAHYKLTSTAMLWLQTIKADSGTMNLGGSLTRQTESDHAVSESSPHIANIGKMVEVGGGSGEMRNRGLISFFFDISLSLSNSLIY